MYEIHYDNVCKQALLTQFQKTETLEAIWKDIRRARQGYEVNIRDFIRMFEDLSRRFERLGNNQELIVLYTYKFSVHERGIIRFYDNHPRTTNKRLEVTKICSIIYERKGKCVESFY